jgi:hypothetical protein
MLCRFCAAFSSGAIACWQATESRVRDAETRTNEAGLDRDWLKLVCRRRIAAGNENSGFYRGREAREARGSTCAGYGTRT